MKSALLFETLARLRAIGEFPARLPTPPEGDPANPADPLDAGAVPPPGAAMPPLA